MWLSQNVAESLKFPGLLKKFVDQNFNFPTLLDSFH